MTNELLLQAVTAVYALCNAARLLSYVPQIIAVAREDSGAYAISMVSWIFWSISHAATALYCTTVVNDLLLAGMMWGNTAGCFGVLLLTVLKRRRYGWVRTSSHSAMSGTGGLTPTRP